MSYFKLIQTQEFWLDYFNFEAEKILPERKVLNKVKRIIEKEQYTKFNENYFKNWSEKGIPKFVKIPKFNTKKTRDVFIYKFEYNVLLKAMSYYLLLQYNDKFSENSLAYTWGKGPKNAFRMLESFKLSKRDTIYKNDFSDYFNKIDLTILEPKLRDFLNEDEDLVNFVMTLLQNPKVTYKGEVIEMEQKGVMAGTPISGLLSNIYMHEVDILMKKKRYKYIRYADDTLIVGQEALDYFKKHLENLNINFNPKKEEIFNITTGVTFLGFKYINRTIDISDESKAKMKSRMKRRARWYRKWARIRRIPIETAIKDYIGGINEKLFTDLEDSINWTRWYIPSINTVETIDWLDKYYINCIRYLHSGTWSYNARYFSLTYERIKELGYVSLVNTYYRIKKGKKVEYNPLPKYKRERKPIDFPIL